MVTFTKINIIYNPKSSGKSKRLADELRSKLKAGLSGVKIVCVASEYAGHARELAHKMALDDEKPLIISSSGDGGYNEVINGVMSAANPYAVCAVLPAGNANDHSRAVHRHDIAESIIAGKIQHLDLIRITTTTENEAPIVRYAHSYVGLGITPALAAELAAYKLHIFQEFLQILRLYRKTESFKIDHQDKVIELDNLLFTNIYLMAKILTFAPKSLPNDGKFEVIISPSNHKAQLTRRILRAAVARKPKAKAVKSMNSFMFKTMHDTLMQMDGELVQLASGSTVVVESAHNALATII